jgi:hypothetical protein
MQYVTKADRKVSYKVCMKYSASTIQNTATKRSVEVMPDKLKSDIICTKHYYPKMTMMMMMMMMMIIH